MNKFAIMREDNAQILDGPFASLDQATDEAVEALEDADGTAVVYELVPARKVKVSVKKKIMTMDGKILSELDV